MDTKKIFNILTIKNIELYLKKILKLIFKRNYITYIMI